MLILTRRVGETIRINDDISIQVLSVSGQQVKIGITAPADVAVHRDEIYQRIQAGRREESAARSLSAASSNFLLAPASSPTSASPPSQRSI